MDIISAFLLLASASLASVRNVLLKSFSPFSFKNREFFGLQAGVFGTGSVALLAICAFNYNGISLFTALLALVYGVILLCAQWCYTIALSNGKTAICVTIYSFGFLIPTLSGAIFWNEQITIFGGLGILTVIPVILISGLSKKDSAEKSSSKAYLFPLLLALIGSGGLGVVQKLQQNSEYKSQSNSFVLVAFVFCFVVSLLFFAFMKKGECQIKRSNLGASSIIGVFFAVCNLLNTYLAGKLNSAVFFPVLNIGGILISTLLGIIIYKERLTKKDLLVLSLAIVAIILVNF